MANKDVEEALEDVKRLASQQHPKVGEMVKASVPEQIAKTADGIEKFGRDWAQQIRDAAQKQLEEDQTRYELAVKIADEIEQKGISKAKDVADWAVLTRDCGLGMKDIYSKLNGGSHPPTPGPNGGERYAQRFGPDEVFKTPQEARPQK